MLVFQGHENKKMRILEIYTQDRDSFAKQRATIQNKLFNHVAGY